MKGLELFRQPSIVQELLQHISPMEYVTLRQTIPLFLRRANLYPSVKEFALHRVNCNMLSVCTHDFAHVFVNQLRHNKCFALTGGALLTVLHGDDPEPEQDYDVFFVPEAPIEFEELANRPISNVTELMEYLPDLNVIMMALLRMRKEYHMNLTQVYPTTEPSDRNIFTITITTSTKFKMQFLVHASRENIPQHLSQFDLSFCANTLGALSNGLFMKDVKAVQSRTCTTSMELYVQQKLCVIPNLSGHLLEQNTDTGFVLVWQRWEKYRRRGYEIEVVFDPTTTYRNISGKISFIKLDRHSHGHYGCTCNDETDSVERSLCFSRCIEQLKIQKTHENKLCITNAWNAVASKSLELIDAERKLYRPIKILPL